MRLAAAIAVTFGALLMLVSVTWMSTTQLIREARWVDHTKDVLAELEGVQALITEGETGQRGLSHHGRRGRTSSRTTARPRRFPSACAGSRR